jgi:hypothetical protein
MARSEVFATRVAAEDRERIAAARSGKLAHLRQDVFWLVFADADSC